MLPLRAGLPWKVTVLEAMKRMEFGGNGSGKSQVVREPITAGWVIYKAGQPPPPVDELPLLLIQTLQSDLAQHANVRMHSLVPLVRDGNTVALCMGYVTLPEGPPGQQAKGPGETPDE
jgi:hypothetical protein